MESKGRILVVDDDPGIRKLLRSKLTKQGYEVITARDGEEGLEKYKSFSPDIIILDILMPKMDGYTFVLEFKQIGDLRKTPVIVLSAKDNMQDIFRIEGVNDYIIKPFKMEDLLRKIGKRMAAKNKKILIVDDEIGLVDVMKNLLSTGGYDVLTAFNGLEALEKARGESPDAMIMDVLMPKLDGQHVCRLLKFDGKYKHIPIILTSAFVRHADNESPEVEVGADAYLAKPCDGPRLMHTLKTLLWD